MHSYSCSTCWVCVFLRSGLHYIRRAFDEIVFNKDLLVAMVLLALL